MGLSPGQRKIFRDLAQITDGIDEEVYARFGKDPLEPIVGLGAADARVGFFGRDPGRDEVQHGEPFIGAGGQLVRKALYEAAFKEACPDWTAASAPDSAFSGPTPFPTSRPETKPGRSR